LWAMYSPEWHERCGECGRRTEIQNLVDGTLRD
jgi:hypothetical protein